ncbi:MAG: ABC transporter permease [Trueperaceae bacterium]
MTKMFVVIAAAILIMHGLIHLMGTMSYLQLGTVQGLPYKTTLLNGRWVVGDGGIHIFGALWLIPALGFVVVALALFFGWTWWQPILLGVTLVSLVLTLLDWGVAFTGVVVNVVILVLLYLAPSVLERLAP